jgi:hypothetical protein
MKKIILLFVVILLVIGGYLTFTPIDSTTPRVNAAIKPYTGTIYVAGMGGHFTVADVVINPDDTEQPIKVKNLNKMDIGNKKTHPTHDPRIDNKNRNIMFWSTYKYDPNGNLHVGKSDLKTGKVLKDIALPRPDRAKQVVANYCGSGQTANSFMPVSMSDEGYIDVFDKETLEHKHRIWVSELGYKPGTYTFAHGTNTPDGKYFLLTLNLTPNGFTKWTGNTHLILLDIKELEKGKVKKIAEGTITGTAGKTITFRQYFTNDGKYILQSGADRGYLIDAKTLKVIDEITPLPGENHDIIPTPDDNYAIMTLRQKIQHKGKEIVDGSLLLYDIKAKKTIGKPTSVCYPCHKYFGKKAVLCGIEANWKS